jgi:hypothetical protein
VGSRQDTVCLPGGSPGCHITAYTRSYDASDRRKLALCLQWPAGRIFEVRWPIWSTLTSLSTFHVFYSFALQLQLFKRACGSVARKRQHSQQEKGETLRFLFISSRDLFAPPSWLLHRNFYGRCASLWYYQQ